MGHKIMSKSEWEASKEEHGITNELIHARRQLTFEEYVELGKKCKLIEKTMLEINQIIYWDHPTLKPMKEITGSGTRSYRNVQEMIQKKMSYLKSALENNLNRDYYDRFDTHVFYGTDEFVIPEEEQ